MLDERDLIIINKLRKDARVPVSKLAKELKISNTAVKKRIEKLEREGIISGYTIKVNDQLLGNKKALLILHVPFENSTALVNKIVSLSEKFDSVYYRSSSNAYMFYIIVDEDEAHNIEEELRTFIDDICPITLLERLL